MDTPAFHPQWLVDFWLTTPVINKIEPHLASLIVLIIIGVVLFRRYYKGRSSEGDTQEAQFQYLLRRKQVIEKEINSLATQLENKSITEEDYEGKLKELEQFLDKVNDDLQAFT